MSELMLIVTSKRWFRPTYFDLAGRTIRVAAGKTIYVGPFEASEPVPFDGYRRLAIQRVQIEAGRVTRIDP